MHLGLVLAVGAEPLPGEGDRVEAQHLDAEVGEVEHDVGELDEDVGVGPVEVPLPLVEGRPDPRVELGVPREVAGGEVGEDLGQRALVGVRHLAVGEDVEVVAVARLPRARPPGPLVLAGDVVEHEVEHERDAVPAQGPGQLAEVVDVTEVGPHRAVVLHGVAAVVVALARLQQRHEVQVGHAEVAQVGQPARDAGERVGESLCVAGISEHVGLLQPVGSQQPALVEMPQLGLTRAEAGDGATRPAGASGPRRRAPDRAGSARRRGRRTIARGAARWSRAPASSRSTRREETDSVVGPVRGLMARLNSSRGLVRQGATRKGSGGLACAVAAAVTRRASGRRRRHASRRGYPSEKSTTVVGSSPHSPESMTASMTWSRRSLISQPSRHRLVVVGHEQGAREDRLSHRLEQLADDGVLRDAHPHGLLLRVEQTPRHLLRRGQDEGVGPRSRRP